MQYPITDRPPARPRRSFDVGKKALYWENIEKFHDRFQLSKSEHTSSSLSPPSFPNRPAHIHDSKEHSKDNQITKSSETPKHRRWLLAPTDRVHCAGGIRPASMEENDGESSTAGRSEHGTVTLRVSSERILRGTRELSTSQHLRRSCPSRASAS